MTTPDDTTPTTASTAPDAGGVADIDRVDPRADSLRAGETPPHADAERMEAALRLGGPLVPDDEAEAQARREQPTEDGPGTSLN